MKFEALELSRTGEISLKKPGGRLAAWAVQGWLLSMLLACIIAPSLCWLLMTQRLATAFNLITAKEDLTT